MVSGARVDVNVIFPNDNEIVTFDSLYQTQADQNKRIKDMLETIVNLYVNDKIPRETYLKIYKEFDSLVKNGDAILKDILILKQQYVLPPKPGRKQIRAGHW